VVNLATLPGKFRALQGCGSMFVFAIIISIFGMKPKVGTIRTSLEKSPAPQIAIAELNLILSRIVSNEKASIATI
jgi:hypothetical protein